MRLNPSPGNGAFVGFHSSSRMENSQLKLSLRTASKNKQNSVVAYLKRGPGIHLLLIAVSAFRLQIFPPSLPPSVRLSFFLYLFLSLFLYLFLMPIIYFCICCFICLTLCVTSTIMLVLAMQTWWLSQSVWHSKAENTLKWKWFNKRQIINSYLLTHQI